MKKKTVVISSFVMCLVLVISLISVSVAWFSNILSADNKIIISSEKPLGQATIKVESASNSADNGDKLTPAIIKRGIMLDGYDVASIDVLDKNNTLVDTTAPFNTANKPLMSKATTVTVTFPYLYIGAPDSGYATKDVDISIDAVYNKEHTINGGADGKPSESSLTNYKNDFAYSFKSGAQKTNSTKLHLSINPGTLYNCTVVFNFARIDEQCDQELLNKMLYFKIKIEAVAKGADARP
ncbi:MAG: hypothetical protein RSA24_04470 [Clostridia bacterium]